jgi:hypothetical protein
MKKIFKIILKIVGGLITLLLLAFGIIYAVYNEPIPVGKEGPAADALANKFLQAVNHEAFKNTRYLEWSFDGGKQQYVWDKENGKVQVKWKDYSVDLNLNNPNKSQVKEQNIEILGDSRNDLIKKATAYFNNYSFWVVAPFKVFDKGTQRSLVTMEDGTERLLVTYSSGGTTPGDAYLWKLLPNGFPQSYQMWVKIIPVGGIEASWDDWQIMESGVALPVTHKLGPVTLYLGNVKGYN